MKRDNLIKHLFRSRCVFIREGARHTVFLNPLLKKTSTVPRHSEVDNFMARKICRDLGIESPKKY